ncbi:SOS response-associated peptidase [Azospirillum lipoferum]|uniref:Abasic site processing protein n=2 Tax=Azospirillaceae TaxID=2829815 RepID=A0A5A9GWH5_AZOLI|nr:SOS response-associated peptidase [Azospirillum lipoferum]
MCGRMLLTTPINEIERVFGVPERWNLMPRWNIAPTQEIPVIRREEDGRHLAMVRWGLVPPWADDSAIGGRMINARGESVADKPAFRDAFRKRRCLIPLDGFYEWTSMGEGAKARKQGHVIRRRNRGLFALAGLWERWRGPKGAPPLDPPLETATVVTTATNATLSFLHDRMPVVLDPADWDAWLDPATPLPVVEGLIRSAPEEWLDVLPVGPKVNSVRNDDCSCLDPPQEIVPAKAKDRRSDDQPSLF